MSEIVTLDCHFKRVKDQIKVTILGEEGGVKIEDWSGIRFGNCFLLFACMNGVASATTGMLRETISRRVITRLSAASTTGKPQNRKDYKDSVQNITVTSIKKEKAKTIKVNKNRLIYLALLISAIAFSCAFYMYQTHGPSDSTTNVTPTFNTTPTPTKSPNETTNTTNQTAFSIPLEKPPFI